MPPGPAELITAVNHPLRRRILRIYLDDSLREATAAELARILDEPAAKVAYHLKTLVRCDMLRSVEGAAAGERGEERVYAWALGRDGQWLRLVIDIWAQSDLPG